MISLRLLDRDDDSSGAQRHAPHRASDKTFGEHAVIGGVCLVAAEIDTEGRIVQLADVQRLVYGERNGESTPRLKTLDATLQGAGFDPRLSTDIMQEMWEKWIRCTAICARAHPWKPITSLATSLNAAAPMEFLHHY